MDVYLACLLDAQQHSLLNEVDVAKVFLNLKELYIIHLSYWQSTFLPILNDIRQSNEPMSPGLLLPIYSDLAKRLQNNGSIILMCTTANDSILSSACWSLARPFFHF